MFAPRKIEDALEIDVDLQLPAAFEPFYDPYRYKIAYGGRGGTKSWSFARMLIDKCATQPLQILCGRELQSSIDDSVHRLLENQIFSLGQRSQSFGGQRGQFGSW